MYKDFKQEIKEHISTDGIYCNDNCYYKHSILCTLFITETGYNFTIDKAKRCKECLYILAVLGYDIFETKNKIKDIDIPYEILRRNKELK